MAHLREVRTVVPYILIAYAVSWAIEIPLALSAQGVIPRSLPAWMHYLAAFGPAAGGIAMTWREGGTRGLRDLLAGTIRWRVGPAWWFVALSPVLLFLVVAAIAGVLRGTPTDLRILNRIDFLPDTGGAAVLVWLATYGFGEEIGWRGYLLPRLQRDRSAWSASVVLWSIWALWHVPSFFYLHTVSGPATLAGFLVGVLAGSVFLTWLYNSSGGSVLLVAVWHGLFDYVTACTECKAGPIAAAASTLVIVWAAAIVLLYRFPNLSTKEKHVL